MTFFRDCRFRLFSSLLIALAAASVCLAAPGDVDTSFDPGQILWKGAAFPAFKYAVAIQPDGKTLIGGRFDTVQGAPRTFVARLHPNGSLDSSFNPALQVFPIGGQPDGEVYDIVLQPDSKILVSGYFGVGGQFKTVVRLNSDGSMDPGFNVTTNNGNPSSNLVYRLLLQPDGKIIIGSNSLQSVNGVTTNRIARLFSNGALDTPLGVIGNVSSGVFALALQSDGKIIVAGSGGTVARLNADGTEDPAWNYPDIGPTSVDSLAVDTTGRILVGARGRLTVNGSLTDGLIRLNPDGTFDMSFNPPDVRTAFSLLVQNDGRIVVGGTFTVNFGQALSTFGRLNPDGSLNFLCNGGGPDNDIFDIARQNDGKFIAVGAFENFYQETSSFVRTGVARILEANAPPPPPPTGRIAFNSRPDGINLEIYTINPDGSNQLRLTTDPAADYDPSISSAGTKIAFVSDRDSNDEIYIMNYDGSSQNRLTKDDSPDLHPAISPDGTRIAFSSLRDGNWEIYVMDSNGANQTRLTTNTFRDDEPSFSPDGTKIVFRTNRDGVFEIYSMDVNGANPTRLTNSAGESGNNEPAFSPDGTKVAFKTFRDGNPEIYVMNANGSSLVNLTNNPSIDQHPTWSPDGSRIGFVTDRNGTPEIYYMNVDGSGQIRVTNNAVEDSRPSWGGASTVPPPVKLKVAGGNVLVGAPGEGIILRSPNGTTCVKIAIDNAGEITATITACP